MPTPSLSKTRTGGSPVATKKSDPSKRISRDKPGGASRSAPKPGGHATGVAAVPETSRRQTQSESAPAARADKRRPPNGTQEKPERRPRAASPPAQVRSGRGGQAQAFSDAEAALPASTPTALPAADRVVIAMP